MSREMPQSLQGLVALPPVREVEEIDAVKIHEVPAPFLRRDRRRRNLRRAVGVPLQMPPGMGVEAGDESIRRKRMSGVPPPRGVGGRPLDKRHGPMIQFRSSPWPGF